MPTLLTTTASRIGATVFIVSAVDILTSPALGYFRDHVIGRYLDAAGLAHHAINLKEAFLLPLILLVHIACAIVVARVAVLRNPGNRTVGRHVLWGAIISLPVILVAALFDEFFFMQIPW